MNYNVLAALYIYNQINWFDWSHKLPINLKRVALRYKGIAIVTHDRMLAENHDETSF